MKASNAWIELKMLLVLYQTIKTNLDKNKTNTSLYFYPFCLSDDDKLTLYMTKTSNSQILVKSN